MALQLHEETKVVNQKTYDRCFAIDIRSILNADGSQAETVHQFYERVIEIDGNIVAKTPSFDKEYLCSGLVGIKFMSPWGKEITGADVMWFIKYWNDHFEEGLAQLSQS
jgi:hypothetical protein